MQCAIMMLERRSSMGNEKENYTYKEWQEYYTRQALLSAYKEAVHYEKLTELLIYKIMLTCLEEFKDITVPFEEGETIGEILKSWARNEENNFGKNSIRLTPIGDGGFNLECRYDLIKLTEDIEMITTDLFGTLSAEEIGEKIIEEDMEIKDFEKDIINKKLQRKRIQIPIEQNLNPSKNK